MRVVSSTITAMAMLAVSAAGLRAQSIEVQGSTTGCFAVSCTGQSSVTQSGLTFTGTNFDWTAVANTPQTVDLGSLTVKGNGFFGLGGFDTDLKLSTTITDPSVSPSTGNYIGTLAGNFIFSPGSLTLDFDNSTKQYNYDGGTIYLAVNDLNFDNPGTKSITGTLTYVPTTTPEPASLALLGTGLIGLVPLARRRKQK